MPSITQRIRLDVDRRAIESLEQALPAIYNLRPPQNPVKFSTIVTTKSVESAIGEIMAQNTRLSLPLFVIRRQAISIAPAEFFNNYAATTRGIKIGITEDRQHAIMLYPTSVKFAISITLLTDDFDVLDHFIKVLVMYCKNAVSFGDIVLDDMKYGFPVDGSFGENYDYPDFTKDVYSAFSGFEFNTTLELSTYIADLLYIPTIGSVTVQPVVVNQGDFDSVASILTDDVKIAPFLDPKMTFNINLRDKIMDPAKRD